MAHKEICQLDYSLHYTPGVRRTDGEGIERNWASLNGAAPSMKAMGPGACCDTLDEFFNILQGHLRGTAGGIGVMLSRGDAGDAGG
jgi:hypothetical protein